MDIEQTVTAFFLEHAQPIHPTVKHHSITTRHGPGTSVISLTITHESRGQTFFIPPPVFGGRNAHLLVGELSEAEIEEIIQAAPYTLSVKPLEAPEAREGHMILPLEWYVRCHVDAPSIFNGTECIQKISGGTRVEHFFVHDHRVMEKWRQVLKEIAAIEVREAMQELLRPF